LDTRRKAKGPRPAWIAKPHAKTVKTTRRDNLAKHQLRLGIGLSGELADAFLLVPE
jgi:hypothetical protein